MSLDQKITQVATRLKEIAHSYAPVVFANSYGAEDMVLMDLIAKHAPEIEIFVLDTGRLPEETYKLIQRANEHYHVSVRTYFPKSQAVEQYLSDFGPNAFYQSRNLRKTCCHMRKIEPLKRALAGKRAWITGLRREQAITRINLAESEFDTDNGLQKFNPLIDWTHLEVWTYIKNHDVPYNELHDQGYPSIGCAPCTRAIKPGEDARAGRWWWESPEQKECGLHYPSRERRAESAVGQTVRSV